jgi:hypothetical protein
MKKLIFIFLFSFLLLPSLVLAGPNINAYTENIATKSGYDAANETTLSETIGKYIRIALSMVGTIFLVFTVYAGFLWMTAAGNEDQVTKATDIIKMATTGLVIALASFSITYFVISKTGSSTQGPATPAGGTSGTSASTESGGWWSGFSNAFKNNTWGK